MKIKNRILLFLGATLISGLLFATFSISVNPNSPVIPGLKFQARTAEAYTGDDVDHFAEAFCTNPSKNGFFTTECKKVYKLGFNQQPKQCFGLNSKGCTEDYNQGKKDSTNKSKLAGILADVYCTDTDNVPTSGVAACKKGFLASYLGTPKPSGCDSDCNKGYEEGQNKLASDPESARKAAPGQCQGWNTVAEIQACIKGVDGKKSFRGIGESCVDDAGHPYGDKPGAKLATACTGGFNNTEAKPSAEMKEACKDYAPGGSKANNTYLNTCYAGFYDEAHGKNEDEACKNRYVAGSPSLAACIVGFEGSVATAVSDDSTCDNPESVIHLEWLFCPILAGMDDIVKTVNNEIENQLSFNVRDYLSDDVHQTWAIIRNITSAILVIILLVMVFSQAIGGGPFDAYTIRKLLPKLVIAVILIQVSWELLIFCIQTANILGRGIKELLFLPFGGGAHMSLEYLLGRLGWAAPGLAIGTFFTTLAIGGAVSGLTVAGVGLIALAGALSVLVAIFVLLLRQILIIVCVIMAPIALTMWILPGTQRYYKMWYDNVTRLLLMFPIVIAIIAVGRIFAYITAGITGGSKFIAIFAVLIGFFAPYWFLPKAFRWGGSAMAAVTGAVGNATKWRNAPRKYALGQAKINREHRAEARNARLAEDNSEHPRWDSFLAGRNNLALSQRARERRFESNRAKGRKAAEEEAVEAIVGSEYENLDHPHKIDTLRTVAQGHQDPRTGINGHNNPALQRWAMDELAKYGDWDIISNVRENGNVDERVWQAFLAKNISAVHQNAPHLSPQRTDLSTQGDEDVVTYKDFEMTELANQAVQGYTRDGQTGAQAPITDPNARAAQAVRHVTRAQRILGDSQLSRRLTEHGRQQLQRIIDDTEINTPTAQYVPPQRGGGRGQVVLPTNLATGRDSLNQLLAQRGPGGAALPQSVLAAEALANRVADANPAHHDPAIAARGQADEQAFIAHMNDLQAQNSTTSLAIRNELATAVRDNLNARVVEAERAAVEAGHSQVDIQTARHNAELYRDQTLANLGL